MFLTFFPKKKQSRLYSARVENSCYSKLTLWKKAATKYLAIPCCLFILGCLAKAKLEICIRLFMVFVVVQITNHRFLSTDQIPADTQRCGLK